MFSYRIWDAALEHFRPEVYPSREDAETVARRLNGGRGWPRYTIVRGM